MVKLQILDQTKGHLELELSPSETVEKIKGYSDSDKWLFVDGQPKNFSSLSESDIESARVVKVTEQLQEG